MVWLNERTVHYVILRGHYYSILTFQKRIVHLLWTETVGTAAYIFVIRVPNRGIITTTPYFEYRRKPSVRKPHLRIFGAKAFVCIPDSIRHKMDPKAKKMIFVGYDRFTDKVYRVFDPEKKIVERVADVTIEDI